MKNLFTALLVAFTVSTSSVSFAAPTKSTDQGQVAPAAPASATVTQVIMSKLDVVVKNTGNIKMTIGLTDATGRSIAYKTLPAGKTDMRVRFDIDNLADGMYQVKVWTGKHTQVQQFALKTAAVSMTDYQKLALIQKPALIQNLAIL